MPLKLQAASSILSFVPRRSLQRRPLIQIQASGMKAGSPAETRPKSAAEAAQSYYDNYNAKRIDKIMDLMAEDCVYEGRLHLAGNPSLQL